MTHRFDKTIFKRPASRQHKTSPVEALRALPAANATLPLQLRYQAQDEPEPATERMPRHELVERGHTIPTVDAIALAAALPFEPPPPRSDAQRLDTYVTVRAMAYTMRACPRDVLEHLSISEGQWQCADSDVTARLAREAGEGHAELALHVQRSIVKECKRILDQTSAGMSLRQYAELRAELDEAV